MSQNNQWFTILCPGLGLYGKRNGGIKYFAIGNTDCSFFRYFFFYMHGLYGSPYGYIYTYSAELVRHLVCWSNMEKINLEGSSDVAEVWGSLQNIGPA